MMENFTERLIEKRKAAGLSRTDIAERLYISKDAYIKWEQGKNIPRLPDVCSLAEVLNTTVSFLIGEKETEKEMDKTTLFNNLYVRDKSAVKPVIYEGIEEVVNGWNQYSKEFNERCILESHMEQEERTEQDWRDYNIFIPMVDKKTREISAVRDYGMYEIDASDIMIYTNSIPFDSSNLGMNERYLQELADKALEEYFKAVDSVTQKAREKGKKPLLLAGYCSRNNYVAYSIEENRAVSVIEYKTFLDNFYVLKDNEPVPNEEYVIIPPTEDYIKALNLDLTLSVMNLTLQWDSWREMNPLPYADSESSFWKAHESKVDIYNDAVYIVNVGRKKNIPGYRKIFHSLELWINRVDKMIDMEIFPDVIVENAFDNITKNIRELDRVQASEKTLLSAIFGEEEVEKDELRNRPYAAKSYQNA